MSTIGSDESHILDDVTVSVSGDLPIGGGDTLFSRGTDDWDQTNTWSTTIGGASCGCTPNANSVVYVLFGDWVLLDNDADAKELHIEFGGRMDWDADNVELTIHDDGIVEVSVGARLFENGRGNAFLEFDGTGNHTLAVYCEDVGLEVDQIRVTENCSLTVVGNGRIDVEDDFELVANGATVINQFTNLLYIQDDLDLLGDDVVFHNDRGYLYIDGTLEILGERTEIINRDSIYVDLDFHGENADDGTFENHGYIHCNDDVIMSNNSDDYRIDNFGFWRIDDDLRESGTGAVANEFHNRSGSYFQLVHNSSELDWQLWALRFQYSRLLSTGSTGLPFHT